MLTVLGIDQLHVHPKPIAVPLHRAFEHVADVQFSPDLPYVDFLSLIFEGAVPADYKQVAGMRQVRGQTFGHTLHEIVVLRITAEIDERQHNDGKTWRTARGWNRAAI